MRLLLLAVLASSSLAVQAANPYRLTPLEVATDTYAFIGKAQHFTFKNNGNIVNTGFIVSADGVVVIDTGPSRLYGEAMRKAIASVTDRPVVQVYITHHHPDHFLGNQAFADVPIAALAATTVAIRLSGDDLASNLYNLVGGAMRDTEVVAPTHSVEPGSVRRFGAHSLELIASRGHTASDLAVYDRKSGVLFAGDLAFLDRAPTTPNADLPLWLDALDVLEDREAQVVVPGHGPLSTSDNAAISQTRKYIMWLQDVLHAGADRGLDMPEVMYAPLPPQWNDMAVQPAEFRRSVAHLYPAIEAKSLAPAKRRDTN